MADIVTIEKVCGQVLAKEMRLKSTSDGGLARGRESGKPDREAGLASEGGAGRVGQCLGMPCDVPTGRGFQSMADFGRKWRQADLRSHPVNLSMSSLNVINPNYAKAPSLLYFAGSLFDGVRLRQQFQSLDDDGGRYPIVCNIAPFVPTSFLKTFTYLHRRNSNTVCTPSTI